MKVFFVSLGCDKNRVDSERMLGLLEGAGFSFASEESEADIIVINTCCFIDTAKEESIEAILEMARYKEEGSCVKLIVCGCMAERYKEEIKKELPEVDEIVGVGELSQIIKACAGGREDAASSGYKKEEDIKRVVTTGGHYEFLKIADGCDKRCTYCIIPYLRGPYKSVDMESLVSEAESLAAGGVKELIVVAQETTLYGRDLYGKDMLPELLTRLCRIDGLRWIRLLYAYPEDITDELLCVMAKEEKIVKYIDMPIQHASDKILKRMGRRTNCAELRKIIGKARKIMPQIALRTSLITGFPGETDEDFRQLCSFVEEIKFDRLGTFIYSCEDKTPAASFAGQIPEEIKLERQEKIMSLQQEISRRKNLSLIGKTMEVFVEGYLPEDDIYVGRTYMDSPDVDSLFYFGSGYSLMSGDLVLAEVTDADEYDLFGVMTQKL